MMQSVLDTLRAYSQSAGMTLTVVATRWLTVRSFQARVALAFALYVLILLLGFSLNTGALFAQLGTFADLEQAGVARVWLEDIATGDMTLLSVSFVATGAGITLLAPFTGANSLTLIDDDSAMPFGFARGRRYWDSVFFASNSAVGIIHLLVSVLTASLLSLPGDRFWAIGFAVLCWFAFLLLASASGWVIDLATTVFGKLTKWIYGLILGTTALLVLNSKALTTALLDFVGGYGRSVTFVAVGGFWERFTAFGAIFSLIFIISFSGFLLARRWDSLPAHKRPSASGYRAVGATSSTRNISLTRFFFTVLWRTREVRRTLIAVTVAGAISATYFFETSPESIIAGMVVGIPTVSALVWPANAYGVFGSGLTWLTSLPGIKSSLSRTTLLLSFLQTLTIAGVFILPIVVFHLDSFSAHLFDLTVLLPLNALLVAVAALLLATFRPYTVRLAGKGESILPPSASIGYLVGLGLLCFMNSYAIGWTIGSYPPAAAAYLAGLTLGLVAAYLRSNQAWNDLNSQQKLLGVATGD